MEMWLQAVLPGAIRRVLNERGQAESLVIALIVLVLILILAGRRVVVQ